MQATFDDAFYPFPFSKTETKNGALTGSLGLVYNPTEQWFINANFGTGFRSPNVDDMGKIFDSEPGAVVVPNPDLKPEYAYNYELGLTKIFKSNLKINAGVFYTILKDALVRRDYTFNGQDSIMYDGSMSKVQAIQNASSANVYGFFTGVEMSLRNGLGMSLNFNYQKGEEEIDDGTISASRHAAPWFGDVHLTYTKKSFKLDLYTNAMGEVTYENLPFEEQAKPYLYASDADGNPYCPAWYTLNFKANYKIKERLTLMAGIENITDLRYRPYSSGLVAAGRNLIIAVKMNF
jgi:hemoglobin/transferrin/lactoferrin receptor protein